MLNDDKRFNNVIKRSKYKRGLSDEQGELIFHANFICMDISLQMFRFLPLCSRLEYNKDQTKISDVFSRMIKDDSRIFHSTSLAESAFPFT